MIDKFGKSKGKLMQLVADKDLVKRLGLSVIPSGPVKISRARLSNALYWLYRAAYEKGLAKGEDGGYYTSGGPVYYQDPVGVLKYEYRKSQWRPSHDQALNDLAYENEKLKAVIADFDRQLLEALNGTKPN